jgi:hypothetical protein
VTETIPERARRIEGGHQLPAERFKLGYRYRVKANCQAVHHRGPVIRTVGVNKSADSIVQKIKP